MIATLASDDMFSYWSSCCQGSERVPKILKYIREISFDEALPTASIDLVKGRLKLGVGFFLDQIQAPEDFLFILIHERNHLILTKLYPDLNPENGYPLELFNFAQDAYINAIGRRNIVSTLPERFYKDPLEMVLTGRHSRIDWSGFRIKGDSSLVKEAHQGIYRGNYSLMQALGERLEGVGIPGYRQWMEVMAEWYEESRSQAQPGPAKLDLDTECEGSGQAPNQTGPLTDREACGQTSSGEETENGVGEEGPDQEEASGQARETGPQEEGPDEESEGLEETQPFAWKPEPGEVESVVKSYTPLVDKPPNKQIPGTSPGGFGRDENGLTVIPIPDLKPDDLVVELILETSDISDLRYEVRGFEGEGLQGVEKAIRGILSDQATEKAYRGYSIQVPALISRKNLLSLSLGDFPVIWDKDFELKAPLIDLYVDVSGSMSVYYGYIPYIYDALRRIRGRIYQFSTEVVEADPDDRFLHTSGGTDFDQVAEHILERGTRSLILVSDGCGNLDKTNLNALARQLEGLVYLKVRENTDWNWEEVASQTIILEKSN